MKDNQFVHLHVHSEYSNIRLLDSINKIEPMIKYVASMGQHAMALSDHECLSGHVKFIKAVKSLKEKSEIPQDFKPILGNEIYLVDEDQLKEDRRNNESHFYHFLLLAKDAKGHEQLRELSSRAWTRMFTYKGMDRVPTYYSDFEEVVGNDKGHLIASSACLGGYIPQNVLKILPEDCEDEHEYKRNINGFIHWCIETFGKDNFYIEMQPSLMEEQIEFNKYALRIIRGYGLKHIITCDCHYLRKEDRSIHKAYLTSDEDGGGNREVDDFYSSTYFLTIDEVMKNMSYLGGNFVSEGMRTTVEIADEVEIYDLAHPQIIPKIVLPERSEWYHNKKLENQFKKYKFINKMMVSTEKYDRYLITLVEKGIDEKVKEDVIKLEDYPAMLERIDTECKEIIGISRAKEQPISSYFVTMQKNIDIIWEQAGSIVGTGRGSAGAYVIDYLLGIVQMNPLKQGVEIPHWRFISAERPDYPDIDIDLSNNKRDIAHQCLRKYYNSIGGDLVRVCTFGTESAKSAVQTAGRGLHINNDVAMYLSSLIPVERGKVWSIEDCYYGNEEKGRKPNTEFKNLVDEHEGLLDVAIGIQGLINKRSCHACGQLPVNEPFTKHNALMRTPSGELVSQFDLEDSEYVGNIKYDFLNTKTCAMIQTTLEMLIKYGYIEWQGSLRETYNKYIHPDVLDRTALDMWGKLNRGELISAFQFDSPVGEQALKAIKPSNLLEASDANNLMRLMVENGAEQPLEMYVRYKQNINQWYKDMKTYGLQTNEIKTLKKHLLKNHGVCSTQEDMMMLAMDKDIAGFDIVEANILRKGVAHKIGEKYEEAHKLFFEKGRTRGTSDKLLSYVWDVQIAMQRGYGFNLIHSIEYTYILIQQLNLVYYYPPIFWNTAVLLVESGALEQDVLKNDDGEAEESDVSYKEKTTNYGTIATAIGNMQHQGVTIELPDINEADLRFKPNIKNNSIIFGLKGIMKINNDVANLIMKKRPFASLEDFYKRMVLTKRKVKTSTGKIQNKSLVSTAQTVMLIKAGAFDKIEDESREQILEAFLHKINPDKNSIGASTIKKVIEKGIVPPEFKDEVRIYRFRNYIMTNKRVPDKDAKSVKWYSLNSDSKNLTDYTLDFFNKYFIYDMEEGSGYRYDDEGNVWVAMGTSRAGSFEKAYKEKLAGFMKWLNSSDCLDIYNKLNFNDVKAKDMIGNISTWEMEAMNYYYHTHELEGINDEKYCISDFNSLPREPVIIGFNKYRGRSYPKFELTRIVGTVLDRDKTRHSITLLTPSAVVLVKFYSGQFAAYDKQISIIDERNGKKTILEEGWFKRGNKLLITGFRRGDQFKPKRYKNSIFPHSVQLITGVNKDGTMTFQSERVNVDDR